MTEINTEINTEIKLNLSNRGTSILFFDNKFNVSDYIIKIDDEYKYIHNLGLSENTIKQLFNIYYNKKISDILPINKNINEIMKLLINEYDFIVNNNINILELLENVNTFINSKNYITSNLNIQLFINNNLVKTENTGNTENIKNSENTENYEDNTELMNNYETFNCETFSCYEKIEQNYNIYYNSYFNNLVFVYEYDDYITKNNIIKNLFSELKFIIKCNKDDKKKIDENDIINDIFVDYSEAANKITNFIKNNEINYKPSIEQIKEYINKLFNINKSSNNSLKFSDILNYILSKFNINSQFHSYIKRQLPIILEDLHLNKKRMTDGIYYFDISKNIIDDSTNSSIFNNKTNINSKFDELIKERQKLDDEISNHLI